MRVFVVVADGLIDGAFALEDRAVQRVGELRKQNLRTEFRIVACELFGLEPQQQTQRDWSELGGSIRHGY